LKIALADAVLAKDVFEILIEEVDKEYHTDVKKTFGHVLFNDVPLKKTKNVGYVYLF
jgi:hypothetical protein